MKLKGKKRYIILLAMVAALFLGPQASYRPINGKIQALEVPLENLDNYIAEKEASVEHLKPNNEAHIIWADSIRKTPYSVVYLHGFSASQMEGDPVHREFADRYGCNLFLARLEGHGIDSEDSFAELTPRKLVESAKKAIAIGQLLGEKVIVISTSTGGTLAAYLSAENPDAIFANIMYSPNIDLHNKLANVLAWPWGLKIGQWLEGEYRTFPTTEEIRKYWTTTYRLEGVVCLRFLLNRTMKEKTFKRIKQPLFVGYYYKNEDEHDRTVDVTAIQKFFDKTSTPPDQKVIETFPNVGAHVVASSIQSKDIEDVKNKTFKFAEEVLRLEVREVRSEK